MKTEILLPQELKYAGVFINASSLVFPLYGFKLLKTVIEAESLVIRLPPRKLDILSKASGL